MIIYGKDLITDNRFVTYGRYDIKDNDLYFYYTASGFRASIKGKITLEIEASEFNDDIKRPYITFIIDKKEVRLGLFEKINTFSFTVKNLFELFKSTEGSQSIIIIKKIIIEGTILNALKKEKKVLVLGDSYTCGFGSLSSTDKDPFMTKEEDGMTTYAFMSLYDLNYDMEMLAISGHALYKSPYAIKNIPDYFFQIDQNNEKKADLKQDIDLIIINLGTNDSIYLLSNNLNEIPDFKKAYHRFLNTLREIYPNIPIIMISISHQNEVKDAINEVYNETKFDNIYYLELIAHEIDKEGFGSLGHPKKITHQRWSKELKSFINKNICSQK